MATAKRVKQEDAVTFHKVPTTTQYFQVVVTDGVEKRREPMSAPVTSTFITTTYAPRPDRIVLEMSVEEARHTYDALGDRVWTPTNNAIYTALEHALRTDAVSPAQGTQTSPLKDEDGALQNAVSLGSPTARDVLNMYR